MQKNINSFRFAGRGIQYCFSEPNFRIQIISACLAIGASVFFRISQSQWCIIVICIAVVLSLEMINTSIEKLCDEVYSNYSPVIGVIKDVSAGAVLISSVAAFICACLIFIPRLILLINSTTSL